MARPPIARERLLAATEHLILTRGFEKASLDMICEQAGATKGALFYHFVSKEALAKAALKRYFERLVAESMRRVATSGVTGAKDLLFAYLDAVSALSQTAMLAHGCLLGAVTIECSQTYPVLAQAAAEGFRRWETGLTEMIAAAAAEQGVSIDARGLARTFLAVLEGGLLLDHHEDGTPTTTRAVTHFRTYISYLLKVDKEVHYEG